MPHVSVTSVLLALNVAIFGLMLAWGLDPMQPAIDSLIQWGANYGPKTTQGEWWRCGKETRDLGVVSVM